MINNDGLGAFDNGTMKLPAEVLLFHDLDGDGDDDLISSGLEVHENLGPGSLECTDYPYVFNRDEVQENGEIGYSGELALRNPHPSYEGTALGLYHQRVLYLDDGSARLMAADAGAITNAYVEWEVKCTQPPVYLTASFCSSLLFADTSTQSSRWAHSTSTRTHSQATHCH